MDNLPMKVKKDSIFTKIKSFFKNLFSKNNYEEKEKKIIEREQEITEKNVKKDSFKEDLRKDIIEREKKTKILSYIDNDVNSVYSLSNEKLKELIKIYDEEIKNVDMQIKQLKYN